MRFTALFIPQILSLLVLSSVPIYSDPIDLTSLPVADRDLARRALALLSPDVLPLRGEMAGSEDPIHALCGTLQALALRGEVSRASKRTQEILAFLFQRPHRDFSMLSQDGRFLVHYDRDGFHRVDPTDADQNGHPDYVDAVADVFDDVWRYEVAQLGYLPPPPDDDGVYDIYIRDLSPTAQYGVTYPQTLSHTSSSYIEVDNDFTDPVYATPGLDGLRFTAAHEFFHAVQFRYYLSLEATWWYELTATWMQDEVFTDVNDHYFMVDGYLELPEAAMYEPPPVSFRPYGAMVLAVHLTLVYGDATLRQTFEDLAARSPNPYTILDSDPGLPGGFEGVLPRYWIWNYFTGSRTQGDRYYPEASSYQAVSIWEITPIGGLTLGGFAQIQSLGATYARVNTANKAGGLFATFDLPPGPKWNLDVLLVGDSGVEVIRPQGTTVTVPDAGDYEAVVFIPSVLSLEGRFYDVSFSFRMDASVTEWSDLVGDFDRSGVVGFEDFLAFSESFGKPAGIHDELSDLNADGRVDFVDFLIFARHFGESR